MDPVIKAEWIKRLRSGAIPQIKNQLGDTDGGRCCLGVLCDIAVEQEVISRTIFPDEPIVHYNSSTEVLPDIVLDWSDISGRTCVDLYLGGSMDTLSDLNDRGFTFDQIADVIEYFL